MSVESYLRAAPKAELHVHLEGSIQPATLLELARRNRVELPAADVDGLRRWFVYRDFPHFVEIYMAISRCLRTGADYELIVVELAAELARQNCRYAEVTFSPSTHHAYGVPQQEWWSGLLDGRRRALEEHGVSLNWVFDIVRNVEGPEENRRRADYTVAVAIEGTKDGVVAIGLGGNEVGYPPERFAAEFERAIAAGLKSDPHAGETVGPESIWGAIRTLHADRIGHGVRSVEDPSLVAYLAEHQIPLEVSPTSNVRLGVYPGLEQHPFRRLRDAGVVATVNSDDPPLFNGTLNDDVVALYNAMGMTVDDVDAVLLDAVRVSFAPPSERVAREIRYAEEMAALRLVHLVDNGDLEKDERSRG